MKSTQTITDKNVPQTQEVTKISNTHKFVKVVGTQNSEDRANDIQDMFVPSSNIPQLPVTYGNNQIKPAPNIQLSNPIPTKIVLPQDRSYLDTVKIKKFSETRSVNMSLEEFNHIVRACDDLTEVIDILKWIKGENDLKLFEDCLNSVVQWCDVDKIKKCYYLTNTLKLKVYPDGVEYEKGKKLNFSVYTYFSSPKTMPIIKYQKQSISNLSIGGQILCRFFSKMAIYTFALKRNKIENIDKALRFLLSNFDSLLKNTGKDINFQNEMIACISSTFGFLKPDFQEQFISKYRQIIEETPSATIIISDLFTKNMDARSALELLDKALSLDIQRTPEELGKLFNNMAGAQSIIGEFDKAYLNARKAYEHWPNCMLALKKLYILAHQKGDYKGREEILGTVNNVALKSLLSVTTNWDSLKNVEIRNIIEEISNSMVPLEFQDLLAAARFVSKHVQLKTTPCKRNIGIFEQDIKEFKTQYTMTLALNLSIHFAEYNVARGLLSEISDHEIRNNFLYQQYKTALAETDILAQEISNYDIQEDKKADLHLSAASSCIVAENFKSAGEHLQAAIDAQPENEDYKQVSFLAAVLTDDPAKIESSFNKLDGETKLEIFSTFTLETEVKEVTTQTLTLANTTYQTDTIITDTDYSEVKFDQQKIHAHFQAIKAQDLNELSIFNKSATGWKVENLNISMSKTIPLGKHNGLTYYGNIADKFQGAENAAFKTALEKGFAKRAEGVNGVKAFKGVFEIKIDGNERLYTNKVYKNEQGQLLLIFDKYGNHDAVKLFAKDNKRTEIPA